VRKVKERNKLCEGNEATTKASLIAPLFTLLGWDMADPRECQPEYREDFGKGEKAATPVDWAFTLQTAFAFIVEAKKCGMKLRSYAEQLGMYFAKTTAKLGVFTNGVQWKFYTDLDKANIMDREPFLTWDILDDDPIPLDFLTLLQKSRFQPQLIKTFAERGRRETILLTTLKKLLDPSSDFIKLAIKDIETRALHPNVVEEWRPILVNVIQEWAKRKVLEVALKPATGGQVDQPGEALVKQPFKGKTCPKCGASGLGFKLRVCKCGHVFVFKKDEAEQPAQQPAGKSPETSE
jgi:hypothetical protein